MAIHIGLDLFFPRPYLVKLTQHESGQYGDRYIMEFTKGEWQHAGERRDTNSRTRYKHQHNGNVKRLDRLHDIEVFSEQH